MGAQGQAVGTRLYTKIAVPVNGLRRFVPKLTERATRPDTIGAMKTGASLSYAHILPAGPDQPCIPCRHYRLADYDSPPPIFICALKPRRRDVPFVSGCPSFEREPGADDE